MQKVVSQRGISLNIDLLNKSFLYDRVRPIMTPIVHWPRSPVHMLTWGVPPR